MSKRYNLCYPSESINVNPKKQAKCLWNAKYNMVIEAVLVIGSTLIILKLLVLGFYLTPVIDHDYFLFDVLSYCTFWYFRANAIFF